MKARFSWAKKYVLFGGKWSDVVFTDENKWNLDGLDGFHCYRHVPKKRKKDFPDFLTSVIMTRLFLGLSFSGLPGVIWGVLFLFFMELFTTHLDLLILLVISR